MNGRTTPDPVPRWRRALAAGAASGVLRAVTLWLITRFIDPS